MTRGALLEVVAGKAHGLTLEVQDDLLIGRHAEGPGRLAEDEELSRAHARISVDGTGVCAIEDLGSTNGTFVNGLRIVTPLLLSEGDTIEMGASTLVVRALAARGGAGAPEPPAELEPAAESVAAPPAAIVEAEGLSLRLEVDFEAREVLLALGEDAEPVHLVFDSGAWRAGTASTEKGEPA
jgi:pSer/pThr/pTyr-binding forkhead associated (FHA) protein